VAQNGKLRQAGEFSLRELRRELTALGNLAADMATLGNMADLRHPGALTIVRVAGRRS
jgi:hypothetical protein